MILKDDDGDGGGDEGGLGAVNLDHVGAGAAAGGNRQTRNFGPGRKLGPVWSDLLDW